MPIKLPEVGCTYAATYPFRRDTIMLFGAEDNPGEGTSTWIPGVRAEFVEPDDFEDVCDDTGLILLTVVDVHKPGSYPTRVFFTRKWQDPDGKKFGKGDLHIRSVPSFWGLAKGYAYEYTDLSKEFA